VIKFQQYDNYPISTDEFAFDDIGVTVGGVPPPMAAFSGSPTSGCAPLTVNFTDQSTGDITGWDWDFGDGTAHSSTRNPVLQYTSVGLYRVTLTATGPCGSDGETEVDYITTNRSGAWTVITYDDFESGWGSYTDGGGDCSRYTSGTYAHQGNAAADIQDNSGTASSFYHSAGYNVSGYTELEVEFWFYAVSTESGEDFWVQYYDGSTWRTVATFAPGNRLQQQHVLQSRGDHLQQPVQFPCQCPASLHVRRQRQQ
jgi:PKD repeat protein